MNNRRIINELKKIYRLIPEEQRDAKVDAAITESIEAVERRTDYRALGAKGGAEKFKRVGSKGMSEMGKMGKGVPKKKKKPIELIQDAANQNTNVEKCAITLIQGLADRIETAAKNSKSLAASLRSSTGSLAETISLNTPRRRKKK